MPEQTPADIALDIIWGNAKLIGEKAAELELLASTLRQSAADIQASLATIKHALHPEPKPAPPTVLDLRWLYNGPSPEDDGYRVRPLDFISTIVVHHAARDFSGMTMQQAIETILSSHQGQGWPAIAYHGLYLPHTREFALLGYWDTVRYHADGTVWNPEYRCGQNNVDGVGICIGADFEFANPDAQTIEDMRWILDLIKSELGPRMVKGHKDVAATICPGGNWHVWGNQLR